MRSHLTQEAIFHFLFPDAMTIIASAGRHQTWLAKRVICGCIREICFFRFSMGPKSQKFSTSLLTRHLYTRQLVTELSETSTATRGVLQIKKILLFSVYWFQQPMNIRNFIQSNDSWSVPVTFSILTSTYGFQVSQPKTLIVGICGFRLTVFWWASCEDSICWWEKFYKLKEI